MRELGKYPLPKGWVWATIPELVGKNGVFIDGDWVESKDQDPQGGVRLIQLADVGDGVYRDKSSRFLTQAKAEELGCTFLKDGDVLIARMPDPLGRACVYPGDAKPSVTVVDVAIARSGKGEFDHRWLACFVNAHPFRSAISGLQAGSTRKRISRGNLATIPLPVPPLPEQRQIVGEIEKQFSRLEEGVGALKRVQANLKRYRAAVLKAACEGQLVLAGKQWQRRKLGEITSKIGSGSTPRGGAEIYRKTGVPFIRSKNVHSTGFRFDGLAYIDEVVAKKLDHVIVTAKDVLLNITGASIGRVTTAPASLNGARVNQHVCIIRPKQELLPSFLAIFLASPDEQARVMNVQVGATRQALTKAMIVNWEIPLPPLGEQSRIVAEVERRLSVVEELEATVAANLQRATRLRQSILQKAFEGRLVVNEEATPAAVAQSAKTVKSQPLRPHFARAILSAEIVHRLYQEPSFGRIKHQKIFHLCEHIARIEEIQGQYHREAAGPLDNKLIYSNEDELKRQGWFQEYSRASYGHAYRPMPKAGGHRKYVEQFWPDKLPVVVKLIELMRTWDTERCEIFCTAYAAWNDLILWGKDPTDDAILHEILDCWHESKRRIPEERWKKAIEWMKKSGFAPGGFGQPTKKIE